jgi:hypothetical protein
MGKNHGFDHGKYGKCWENSWEKRMKELGKVPKTYEKL